MKRVIKFRAFDDENMIYRGLHDINWYNEEGVAVWQALPKDINQFKTMQFTGLTDKNGVDIYEGDLFQVMGNNIYEVRYINGCYFEHEWFGGCFILWKDDNIFFPFDENSIKHGEVIGNIHENPELLK